MTIEENAFQHRAHHGANFGCGMAAGFTTAFGAQGIAANLGAAGDGVPSLSGCSSPSTPGLGGRLAFAAASVVYTLDHIAQQRLRTTPGSRHRAGTAARHDALADLRGVVHRTARRHPRPPRG